MGRSFQAKCAACQHTFPASEGGGVCFQSLRCKRCGEDRDVSHDDIRDAYLAYLKGLNCMMAELDGSDGRTYHGEPITRREFRRRVLATVGTCECGGRFSYNAPLRCPACKSTEVSDDKTRNIRFN